MNNTHPAPPPPERRSFLKWITCALGGIFAVVLGAPAVGYLLDPRNRKAPSGAFKPVAPLAELTEGVPYQAVISDVRYDAWTIHPNDIVGRVWLIRRGGDKVDAFTTICPHLGCSINYEATDKEFRCPCHGGTWNVKGEKVEPQDRKNPAPRGMDQLECRVRNGFVEVKYQNFIQGLEHKQAKA